MFGIKIPSLGKFTSRQALPWTLGGLAAGAAAYFILTGRDTGIGIIDPTLKEIGDVTHLEGVFANQVPAAMKPAPGKTTTVHTTPSTAGLSAPPYTGLTTGGGYNEQALTMQFSGVGEFGSFSEDGRLTIA